LSRLTGGDRAAGVLPAALLDRGGTVRRVALLVPASRLPDFGPLVHLVADLLDDEDEVRAAFQCRLGAAYRYVILVQLLEALSPLTPEAEAFRLPLDRCYPADWAYELVIELRLLFFVVHLKAGFAELEVACALAFLVEVAQERVEKVSFCFREGLLRFSIVIFFPEAVLIFFEQCTISFLFKSFWQWWQTCFS
jgi:hypothetical protein